MIFGLKCKKVFMCGKILLLLFVSSYSLYAQINNSLFGKKEKLKELLMQHYKNDVQKQQAATFLIDNIDIQNSQNYNWVDVNGKKIPYNELDFSNIEEAVKAFNKLKDSVKIIPKPYKLMDVEELTPELLIKNIDLAFDSWKNYPWSKSYDFNTFCEYILPYRSLTEPLEDWRGDYQYLVKNNMNIVEDETESAVVAISVIKSLKNFSFVSSRPDPIPYLSPKQLLFRREGACNDLANLALLACRSIGVAVTYDFTPFYGASSNRHFWDTVITEKGEHIPFNGNCFGNLNGFPYAYNVNEKRLAKVFRYTYSIQKKALASIQNAKNIPDGFLKEKNIIDVTAEYVPTGNLKLIVPAETKETLYYLNVFNLSKWQTIDWTERVGNTIEYKDLGVNIVYLPSVYLSAVKKMQYSPYPILMDLDKNQKELKPNYTRTFSYDISRDKTVKGLNPLDFNSFEVFNDELFTLLVWENGWKKLEDAVAKDNKIHFFKIPENGLFLVLCKKSNGYERIFTINSNTKQIEWY